MLPDESPVQSPRTTLPRVLGLWDATALVVGGIIGSGIFFKAQVLAHQIPAFGPIMAVWVLAGLHTLCGTLCLAELAGMLPQAGGPYVYLSAAYGRIAAFLWGWGEFWIIRSASLAALSCATILAIHELIPLSRGMQQVLAIGLIIGLSSINFVATRGGAHVQNLTTVLKVSFLGVLILGPACMGVTDSKHLLPLFPEQYDFSFWRAFGVAAIAVLWPYDGWINLAPVTEEIRDPGKNAPGALILGVGIVIAIYLTVNVSYHLTLPYSALANSEGVAADVCRVAFGPWGIVLATLGVMTSTLGACNGNLLCGPRIYFAMARDRMLPAAVARVHSRHETPHVAIVLQSIWTVALILGAYAWKSGPADQPIDVFDTLTDFAIFGGVVFYGLVVGAVIILRFKHPGIPRPYRTWGYPITPLIYLTGSAGVLYSLLMEKWAQTQLGIGLILSGVVVYFLASYNNPSPDHSPRHEPDDPASP